MITFSLIYITLESRLEKLIKETCVTFHFKSVIFILEMQLEIKWNTFLYLKPRATQCIIKPKGMFDCCGNPFYNDFHLV